MNLFVYGTLKKNCCRHSILEGKFLGNVETLPNYKLYDTGHGFPALVQEDNGNIIQGELWEVDKYMIEYLDAIEGVENDLYKRSDVKLSDGSTAIGYIWARSTSGMIDCGSSWTE